MPYAWILRTSILPAMPVVPSALAPYHRESYTSVERELLEPYFTNLDGPVFALTNLPEVVKGALFARYSRSPKSLRRLFLDEFLSRPELEIGRARSKSLQENRSSVGTERAVQLYRRVFSDFGDDSVAQLGGVHLACEQSSNLLTKILEWGRLAAYLEQSTRYVRYDLPIGDEARWRYYTPPEVAGSQFLAIFVKFMSSTFLLYRHIVEVLIEEFSAKYQRHGDSEGVWKATLKAKACDIARGLLPVATMSNVGIYANGQSYESMIIRMRSIPVKESQCCAEMMLTELRKVIPAFMTRVDEPHKGAAQTEYLREARRVMEAFAQHAESKPQLDSVGIKVDLVDWDRDGETKIVADALFAVSQCDAVTLRARVERLSYDERLTILRSYVGNRRNRRHRPGRAFEATVYHFDIVCDYANFRDLQRHRMLTIEWQRLTPVLGFTMPEAVEAVGCAGAWRKQIEQAEKLYDALRPRLGPDVAQYVLPFSTRIRFHVRMNAREAMHLIELRTEKGGHTQYRQVCHRMLELIRDKARHKAIADAIKFADLEPDYELARLEGERRAELRRARVTSPQEEVEVRSEFQDVSYDGA